jgi:hypothetical protein
MTANQKSATTLSTTSTNVTAIERKNARLHRKMTSRLPQNARPIAARKPANASTPAQLIFTGQHLQKPTTANNFTFTQSE